MAQGWPLLYTAVLPGQMVAANMVLKRGGGEPQQQVSLSLSACQPHPVILTVCSYLSHTVFPNTLTLCRAYLLLHSTPWVSARRERTRIGEDEGGTSQLDSIQPHRPNIHPSLRRSSLSRTFTARICTTMQVQSTHYSSLYAAASPSAMAESRSAPQTT